MFTRIVLLISLMLYSSILYNGAYLFYRLNNLNKDLSYSVHVKKENEGERLYKSLQTSIQNNDWYEAMYKIHRLNFNHPNHAYKEELAYLNIVCLWRLSKDKEIHAAISHFEKQYADSQWLTDIVAIKEKVRQKNWHTYMIFGGEIGALVVVVKLFHMIYKTSQTTSINSLPREIFLFLAGENTYQTKDLEQGKSFKGDDWLQWSSFEQKRRREQSGLFHDLSNEYWMTSKESREEYQKREHQITENKYSTLRLKDCQSIYVPDNA